MMTVSLVMGLSKWPLQLVKVGSRSPHIIASRKSVYILFIVFRFLSTENTHFNTWKIRLGEVESVQLM